MKLVSITSARISPSNKSYLNILEWYLKTHSFELLSNNLLFEDTQPPWPQEWSDQLFVPARNFEQRKRSRRFLNWLINSGVDASKWLNQLESGTSDSVSIAPPRAMGGGVGRAYAIDNKIVKFTTDNKEANRASGFIGVNVPNLTKFHAVAEIGESETVKKRLFVIVMDRVPNRIPGKYRIAANAVYNYLDAYDRPIVDIDMAVSEILSNDRFLASKYRNDNDVRAGIIKILRATDAIYKRTGVMLQDPHGGNVLMRGKDVEFFDVGRSSDYNNIDKSAVIPKII